MDVQDWTERREPRTHRTNDPRTPYEVDHSRLVHCQSFRKLANKVQIIGVGDDDFVRNRLTHSIEVGQVASGVLQQMRLRDLDGDIAESLPDPMLMNVISMAHDIGHPPYGHGGEVALNGCMEARSTSRMGSGFEGNGQTLRILSKLEMFSKGAGANLTRRTLLGILKYPVAYSTVAKFPDKPLGDRGDPLRYCLSKPPKCYLDSEEDVVSWILAPLSDADRAKVRETKAKSIDGSIMDLSDDISYGCHDLEDAIELLLVDQEDLRESVPIDLWRDYFERLRESYPDETPEYDYDAYDQVMERLFRRGLRSKTEISRLVGYMIESVDMVERPEFADSLFRHKAQLRPPALALLEALKRFVKDHIINDARIQHMRLRGMNMLGSVFELMADDPRHMLPRDVHRMYRESGDDIRTICDYVSGLTDNSLMKIHGRIFVPGAGSTFDRI